jgi:hypothetical protein
VIIKSPVPISRYFVRSVLKIDTLVEHYPLSVFLEFKNKILKSTTTFRRLVVPPSSGKNVPILYDPLDKVSLHLWAYRQSQNVNLYGSRHRFLIEGRH